MTLHIEPSDTPTTKHAPSWGGYIVCVVIGFVGGVLIVHGKTDPLAQRVSAVEQQIKGVASGVETAKVDAALAKAAMEADGYLALGTPNSYQDVGPFWQVHGLQLISDPQGCRVTGEILYRLMVRRQNVDFPRRSSVLRPTRPPRWERPFCQQPRQANTNDSPFP